MERPLPESDSAVRSMACAALLLLLAGCQHPLPPRPLAAQVPAGDWAVVEVRSGPVGVRDPAGVIARHGQVIRFEPALARSGEAVCVDPHYLVHAIDGAFYLRREIGLRPAELGLDMPRDARLVEVFCQGSKWRALGGETLFVDDTHVYAVLDNTLYRLRRLGGPP